MHLLNTDVLLERFLKENIPVSHHESGLGHELSGFRYLAENEEEDPSFLYICPAEMHLTARSAASFCCGDWSEEELPANTEYFLCRSIPERELINLLERIFSEHRSIEERVHIAEASASPLFELCEAAVDYFHAVCYYHDEHFFLRAYDRRKPPEGDPAFVYSAQYKSYMQSPAILDELRVNPFYQQTFKKEGPQLWIDSLTGNRCIYVNQFHTNRYLGRLIITVDDITPGIAHAAEYFSAAFHSAVAGEFISGTSASDPMSFLLRSYVEKESIPDQMISDAASAVGWPMNGRYICGMIRFYKNQVNNYMIFGICTSIQNIIPGCRMHYRGNRIFLLINLSVSGFSPADIRMKVSEQIRESLLKAALSDPFRELNDFPLYMQQASACLDYMNETNMTDWFCEYRQIAIPLWMHKGTAALPEDLLIAAGLKELMRYDSENSTSLYKTLEAYLVNERKPVLTSQALHIHRSSLPARLEKITEITGYNLNSPKTRLHLLMSFALMKERGKKSPSGRLEY